jgi:hypothetical protein
MTAHDYTTAVYALLMAGVVSAIALAFVLNTALCALIRQDFSKTLRCQRWAVVPMVTTVAFVVAASVLVAATH